MVQILITKKRNKIMKKIMAGMVAWLLLSVTPTTETEALTNPFTAIKNKVNEAKLSKDASSVASNMLGLDVNERKNIVNSITEFTKSLQNLQKGLEKAKTDMRTQSVNIKTFDSSRSSAVGALAIELVVTDLIEKVKILILLVGAMKSGIQNLEKAKQTGDANAVAGLQQFRLMRDLARLIPLMVVTAKAYVALGGKFVDTIKMDMVNSGKIATILNTVVTLINDNVTKGILKTSKKGLSSVMSDFEGSVGELEEKVQDAEIAVIFEENKDNLKQILKFLNLLKEIFESSIKYANGDIGDLENLARECEKDLGTGEDRDDNSVSISNDRYLPKSGNNGREYSGRRQTVDYKGVNGGGESSEFGGSSNTNNSGGYGEQSGMMKQRDWYKADDEKMDRNNFNNSIGVKRNDSINNMSRANSSGSFGNFANNSIRNSGNFR